MSTSQELLLLTLAQILTMVLLASGAILGICFLFVVRRPSESRRGNRYIAFFGIVAAMGLGFALGALTRILDLLATHAAGEPVTDVGEIIQVALFALPTSLLLSLISAGVVTYLTLRTEPASSMGRRDHSQGRA